MEREFQGYDVLFSGYPGRHYGVCIGVGCSMLNQGTLEKVRFRCREFKNGTVISEADLLEMDLTKLRQRLKRGFFLSVCHYKNENEAKCIAPKPLGLFRRITTSRLVRYALIRASIIVRWDIPWHLRVFLYRSPGAINSAPLPGTEHNSLTKNLD